jgi:hypothetical protein
MNAPNTPNAQRPTPNASAPFRLKTTRGIQADPERIVIHGAPGVGKSTLCADAPSPIFFDLEHGTKQLDIERVDDIETWEQLLAAVRWLINEDHSFKTLVIDTLDRAEWLCWQHVCRVGNKPSIEAFSYGKGMVAAYEAFRVLARELEALRTKRRMRVVLIAHSKIEKVPNPSGEDWERWTLKVDKRVAGLFYESFDAVLFARRETFGQKTETGRTKGVGNKRVVETEESPGWVAKNRYRLPAQIELPVEAPWSALSDGLNRGAREVADAIRAELTSAIARLTALDAAAGEAARVAAESTPHDAARLSGMLSRVTGGIAAREAALSSDNAPSSDNA